MRKELSRIACLLALATTLLTACKKDEVSTPAPPPPPTGDYAIKVRAAITVGDVVYDSIPATLTLSSWDRSGVLQQREVQLLPGTNTLYLPKSNTKYRLRLSKWGVTDERTLLSSEVSETTTYTLGGSKAAKKLSSETGYTYQDGSFQLYNKFNYSYDEQGRLKEIANYFVDGSAATPHLVLYSVDRFVYNGSALEKIETLDKQNPGDNISGFSSFTWTTQGKLASINYGDEREVSSCHIEYVQHPTHDLVRVFFDERTGGSKMEMSFVGGNRVEEKTFIPGYNTATRTFSYDGNINPYVHMKWPNVNFSYGSKNNVVEEVPDFAAVSMRSEYAYDTDGYVTEVQKSEVRASGTKPVFKKVYTY